MKTRRLAATVKPGVITATLTKSEAADVVASWLGAFGANRHGVNAKAYMWHVFSFERYPSISGLSAQAEYEKHLASEYVVLSNDRDLAFITNLRPVHCSLRDYLVFPHNLAWTMAFTHEDGWLGPFFACHQEFERLNAANLGQMQKMRDAERARQKGWC